MKKLEYRAETLLEVIKSIFDDKEINTLNGGFWNGKTVKEALNVTYYAFKHRPINTNKIIDNEIKDYYASLNQGEQVGALKVDTLKSLRRSFCLFYLNSVERLFAKDNDTVAISATLEYWVQTDKIEILEQLIEKSNIELSGERLSVDFTSEDGQTETRRGVFVFDAPKVEDIIEESLNGEMAIVTVGVTMSFVPNIVTYSDYSIKFTYDGDKVSESIPLMKLSASRTMIQKAVPYMANPRQVGQVNLSSAIIFVLSFQGFKYEFIDYITSKALSPESNNNNEEYSMTLTRDEVTYNHTVVIKEHSLEIEPNTGVETHVLTLVTRGYIDNGTSQS